MYVTKNTQPTGESALIDGGRFGASRPSPSKAGVTVRHVKKKNGLITVGDRQRCVGNVGTRDGGTRDGKIWSEWTKISVV